MKLTDFFSTDYVDYAAYDNLRKIASVIDGQKNSSRKILYTVLEKNIKNEIKVSQLGSKVAEFSEYLHGNLDNVIVNLAQTFPGTNNMNLMTPEGNFGTRFSQEASASRYIFTYGSNELFKYFNEEDTPVLVHQTFEGQKIEPRFYVPELPIILINGSEGISSGFAQKILPRSKENIIQAVKLWLAGKTIPDHLFVPQFNGFSGTVTAGDEVGQWYIAGLAEKTSSNTVLVTEVPIGYDLKGYLGVLDALEEKKQIQSYKDLSEDDQFKFEVKFPRKALDAMSHAELLQKLKLVKRVTENYTCMNELNKISVFESVQHLFAHYCDVKLAFVEKRKVYKLQKLQVDIELASSKWEFIQMVLNGSLVLNKRPKSDIERDLDAVESILKTNGSYDYLLNMNLLSLTKERLERLESEIKNLKSEWKTLLEKEASELWGEAL